MESTVYSLIWIRVGFGSSGFVFLRFWGFRFFLPGFGGFRVLGFGFLFLSPSLSLSCDVSLFLSALAMRLCVRSSCLGGGWGQKGILRSLTSLASC